MPGEAGADRGAPDERLARRLYEMEERLARRLHEMEERLAGRLSAVEERLARLEARRDDHGPGGQNPSSAEERPPHAERPVAPAPPDPLGAAVRALDRLFDGLDALADDLSGPSRRRGG